ncbi:hypothetical protein ACJ41O_006300 [Fusarium nematophilum]
MALEQSPRIMSIAWGRIEVDGLEEGKDYKLYPGGGRPWDWSETGTRHNPGIQVADVEELLDRGATTIVLSRGMDLKLQVGDATVKYLEEKAVTVHVAETREAYIFLTLSPSTKSDDFSKPTFSVFLLVYENILTAPGGIHLADGAKSFNVLA